MYVDPSLSGRTHLEEEAVARKSVASGIFIALLTPLVALGAIAEARANDSLGLAYGELGKLWSVNSGACHTETAKSRVRI